MDLQIVPQNRITQIYGDIIKKYKYYYLQL